MRAVISMATLCVLIANPANAVRPDECEQQRAAFPKECREVSKEKPLFFCSSHYSGAFKVTLGAGDKDGRHLMSSSPRVSSNDKKAKQDSSKDVFRIWLDREQTRRLDEGRTSSATIVRQKGSCWIRGALSGPDDGNSDTVFFLDTANPKPDSPDAGSFYNKAPRFSVFQGDL